MYKQIVLCMLLVFSVAAAPTATAHTVSEQTVFLVQEDGNAYVIHTTTYDLSNESETRSFEEIQRSETAYKDEFLTSLQSAAEVPQDATENTFEQDRIRTQTDADSNTGAVTIEFLWSGFATSTTDQTIEIDRPTDESFETGTQTYLYPPQDYVIAGGSTFDDATEENAAIVWSDSASFDGVRLVLESTEPASENSTSDDDASENPANNSSDDTASESTVPGPEYLGGLAFVVAVLFTVWFVNIRKTD